MRGRDTALCRYRARHAGGRTGAGRLRVGSAERGHVAGGAGCRSDDMVVGSWAGPGGCCGRAGLSLSRSDDAEQRGSNKIVPRRPSSSVIRGVGICGIFVRHFTFVLSRPEGIKLQLQRSVP
ncbi:hypothetical protein G6F65_018498 [Rhizopus arrhizus]|nr:hypothetical protein G6F65_018498 [Rhizopus arrhizus]